MKRLIICVVLLIFLIIGLCYYDTLSVRLKLMLVSSSKRVEGNEYIFAYSGYDDYKFRFESSERCLKKDYAYTERYLSDKLKVSPAYYSIEKHEEYCVVWQFEGSYYLLSSIYDLGYKGFSLQKREGIFIEDRKYTSRGLSRLSNHQSIFE